MKIFYRYNIIAGILLMFASLTGCQRTELCYEHYPVADITFTWEHEWERDYGLAHKDSWEETYHGFG